MDPTPVYYARSNSEATMVLHWLEEAGIRATVMGGEAQGGAFEIIESNPVVFVNGDDRERAEQSVAAFREQLQSSVGLDEMSEAEGQFNWPICPICDELREATCGSCGKTGSEFSAEVGEEELIVYCLACGQQAPVEFAERCRYCQHDFTEDQAGLTPSGTADSAEPVVNVARAMFLIVILAVVFGAIAVAMFFT